MAESSPRSFAPMSPACSITASSAGRTSTPAPAASSTSRWSKREPTVPGRSTSAGTEDRDRRERQHARNNTSAAGRKLCFVWPLNPSFQYRVHNRIQYIENIYDYKYIFIFCSCQKHYKPQFISPNHFFLLAPCTSQARNRVFVVRSCFLKRRLRKKRDRFFVVFSNYFYM